MYFDASSTTSNLNKGYGEGPKAEVQYYYTNWTPGVVGYIGFSIILPETGLRHFGWMEVAVDPYDYRVTVVRWAYEGTPETAIAAGDIGDGLPPPPGLSSG